MKVELRDLGRQIGQLWTLEHVTLEVAPGTVLAVVGSNGAGKTTLLRLLGGLLAPSHGEILYDGEPFERARLDLRKRFMFLADAPLLLPDATVASWIGVCMRLYGVEPAGVEQTVLTLLDDFDLATLAGMPLHALSRGQRYKAALAALMVVDPELWLLDEPYGSGMDPVGIAVLRAAVKAAAGRGRTVIFSTELIDLAWQVAECVLVLRGGNVVANGALVEMTVEGVERSLRSRE